MLIENADYFVRLIDMPGSVGGACNPNDDGTFNIYLNARHTTDRDRLIEEYLHEWEHLENDDLYGEKEIAQIEDRPLSPPPAPEPPPPPPPAPEKEEIPIIMIGRGWKGPPKRDPDVLRKMFSIIFPEAFKEEA